MYITNFIISHQFKKVNNYLLVLTTLHKRRLDNKERRGKKTAYVVSCIDDNDKAFCKRIRTKKDAMKYFKLLPSYCENYGKEGLMKIWDEVDKCFNFKITLNKDYIISLPLIVENSINQFRQK